jgi:HK97 family phage portal protein
MFRSLLRADSGGDANDRSMWGDFMFKAIERWRGGRIAVTPDSALALPTVYSAVRVLSESFAVLPMVLYRPSAGGTSRKTIRNHWIVRLLTKAPNAFQSPFEFREMLQGHLALRGNAYCQITANGAGEITDLLPLHPDRMKVELLDTGTYRYRYTDQFGRTIVYRRDEIWHLRGLSSDGIVGMSPIDIAREAIGEGLAMQDYSNRFFTNDAKPGGGWIEVPGSLGNLEQKKEFRNSWQEMQAGKNRGKVAVLERGMKFHELGLNNEQAQFVEARAAKKSDIAAIFRIPPHKLMDLSRSTNNNIEQQAIEFWTDCMLPWTERWEASIECFLLGVDSGLEVEFDMRRMLRGDAASRATYISTLVNASVMTPNEGREMEGLNPIDGLDEPMRPLNMIGLDDVPEEAPASDPASDPKPAEGDAARLQQVLRSNAQRLARRALKPGGSMTAALVSDAMGVGTEAAQAWLDVASQAVFTEQTLTESLMELA